MTAGENQGRHPSFSPSFIRSILLSSAPTWSLATEDPRHSSWACDGQPRQRGAVESLTARMTDLGWGTCPLHSPAWGSHLLPSGLSPAQQDSGEILSVFHLPAEWPWSCPNSGPWQEGWPNRSHCKVRCSGKVIIQTASSDWVSVSSAT